MDRPAGNSGSLSGVGNVADFVGFEKYFQKTRKSLKKYLLFVLNCVIINKSLMRNNKIKITE